MKWLYTACLLALVLIPGLTNAQISSLQPSLNLVTTPTVPKPNERVTVSLNAYTLDTSGATILWYQDGIELIESRNLRSINLVSKDLGEPTTVKVVVTLAAGATLQSSTTITPIQLDVVIEANTLVPSFYQGRPLPSVGSVARAIALVNTGDGRDASTFTYLWKLDNKVLYGGPIKGKQVAEFIVGIGREQTLTVDVTSRTGELLAHRSFGIPRTEPELIFYEENPLRGLSQKALAPNHIMTGDEVIVRAEPYYMARNIFTLNPLIEWKLDGTTISNPNSDPLTVTLRRNNTTESGTARVDFHIRNLNQLLQGVQGRFSLQF